MKVHWPGALLWAGLVMLAHAGEPAAPPETAAPSGGSVVPAPLPEALPGELRDPTKVTPRFEKTFRELRQELHPATPSGATSAAAARLPEIKVLGRICHSENNVGVVMLSVGKQIVHVHAGGETSVFHEGQTLRLRVDRIGEDGVHLYVLEPFNQSLILH